MKQVYSIAQITVEDGEIKTMEPEGKGYYSDYAAASDHAAALHEQFAKRYAILQVIGITGTVIRRVDE